MDSIANIIDTLINFLYSGFRITLPVLILLYLLWKGRKEFWLKLIVTSNILLLLAATIGGLKFLFDLIIYLQLMEDRNPYTSRVMGPYWYAYWLILIGQLVLPHVLWWKKNRWRYGVSLLLFAGLSMGFVMKMIIMFGSNYRNYLPMSWIYYGPGISELLFGFVGYGVLLGVGYVTLERWTGLLVREEVS